MEKLTYFYLSGCPYCKRANKYLEELMEENPKYKEIEIERIEESKQVELANSYDYYYVPCFWIKEKKIHEGAATKEDIKKVLDLALEKVLVHV